MRTKSSVGHASIRRRRWMVIGFVLVALGVAGCGSSSSGTTSSTPAAGTPAETKPAPAQATSEPTSNGIPQGEHAGDGDGDNRGEPSDGDGNL